MNDRTARAAPMFRGAVVLLATLASGACGGSSAGSSVTDGQPLFLQAWGGPAGKVAAEASVVEPGAGQLQTCGVALQVGACRLTSCTLGAIGSPVAGFGDLGPISVSVGTTTVPLTYAGVGYATVSFPSSITLDEGGTMTFQGGDGAKVPAFDVTATIPGLGVITSPVPATDGGAAIVDTSQDLSVTWSPIPVGKIHFELQSNDQAPGGSAIAIACTFAGANGTGAVSHQLLSSMKRQSGARPTYGSLSSELDTTTVLDGLTILTRSYLSSAMDTQPFNVTLQ